MKTLLLTGASLMLLTTASFAAGNHNECVNYVNNFNLPQSGEQSCPGSEYWSRQSDRSDNFAKAVVQPPIHVVTPPDDGGDDDGDTPPDDGGDDTDDTGGDDDGDQTASW
jgi:hypothetical protein